MDEGTVGHHAFRRAMLMLSASMVAGVATVWIYTAKIWDLSHRLEVAEAKAVAMGKPASDTSAEKDKPTAPPPLLAELSIVDVQQTGAAMAAVKVLDPDSGKYELRSNIPFVPLPGNPPPTTVPSATASFEAISVRWSADSDPQGTLVYVLNQNRREVPVPIIGGPKPAHPQVLPEVVTMQQGSTTSGTLSYTVDGSTRKAAVKVEGVQVPVPSFLEVKVENWGSGILVWRLGGQRREDPVRVTGIGPIKPEAFFMKSRQESRTGDFRYWNSLGKEDAVREVTISPPPGRERPRGGEQDEDLLSQYTQTIRKLQAENERLRRQLAAVKPVKDGR